MSLDEACKLLSVSTTTPWAQIEERRRELMNAAHPTRLAVMSEEQREEALTRARRVNVAARVLGLLSVRG